MDSTLKETNLKRSIRKFIIDGIGSTQNLFFDYLYDVPVDNQGIKLTNWIMIEIGRKELDTVSTTTVIIDLFTRGDKEGDKISELTDVINALFRDENSNTGNVRIPFFDTESSPWDEIGGIVPISIFEGENVPLDDKTKIRSLQVELKWGAKA